MSLKAFHILFITLSTLLALGVGAWGITIFVYGHSVPHLLLGIVGLVAAAGLIMYGRYVLKKLKNISYL